MMGDWNQRIRDAAEQAARHVKAVIRKDGCADRPWCVYSKTGKKLGCYPTKEAAQERLRQIEYWRRRK